SEENANNENNEGDGNSGKNGNGENGSRDGSNSGKSNAENDQFIQVISTAIVKDEVKKEEYQTFNINARIRANVKKNILSFSIEFIGCGTSKMFNRKCQSFRNWFTGFYLESIKIEVSPNINDKLEELVFTVEDTYIPLNSKDNEWEMKIEDCPINGPTWPYNLRSDIDINFDNIMCPELFRRPHSGKWLLTENMKEFRITIEQKLSCKITPPSPDKPDKQSKLTRYLIACLPPLTHKLEVSFKVNNMTKFNEDFAELVENLDRDRRLLDINTSSLKVNRGIIHIIRNLSQEKEEKKKKQDSILYKINIDYLKKYDYEEFQDFSDISNGLSEVKYAYLKTTEDHIVLKFLKEYNRDKYYERFDREITNLKKIAPNENVIGFYGVTKDPSKEFQSMVLQYCYGETLREYLKKENASKRGWKYKVKMAIDIAKGLKYIHAAEIVHQKSEADIRKITVIGDRETPVNLTPVDYIDLYCMAWNNDAGERPSIERVISYLEEEIEYDHLYKDSDYIPKISCGNRNYNASKEDACLTVIQGSSQNKYFFLPLGDTSIGRSNSNDIIIKDQKIAREHARIKCYQGKVVIFDLGFESGIFVNDERLKSRISRTLEKDDKIKIGRSVFQYLPTGEYKNRIDKLLPIYNKEYFINDDNGHLAGDYALKELAKLIETHLHHEDIFARFGGEEFTILLKNAKFERAYERAEKIRQAVESHLFTYDDGKHLPVTLSIGVAEVDSSMEHYEDLLKKASQALNIAKRNGRNRVETWTKNMDSK
ncbi:278_t:CDS:2, partial [Gigaspora rosea]